MIGAWSGEPIDLYGDKPVSLADAPHLGIGGRPCPQCEGIGQIATDGFICGDCPTCDGFGSADE